MVNELKTPDLEVQISGGEEAPETSTNPPPPDTVQTQLKAKRVLAATAVRTKLEGGWCAPEALDATLDEYLEAVQFTDPNITPDNIAAAITYATGEGTDKSNRKISPVPSNIAARITALRELKESGKLINVAAVNVGGTNTVATIAAVQNGTITLKGLDKKSFRKQEEIGKPIQCVDHVDYWKRTIPSEFIEKLKAMTGNEETQLAIEIAVAAPVKDGYVLHMSDKASFERDPLAPLNEGESRKVGEDRSQYPTIAQSFSKFLEGKGIKIPPESIFTGENDTINIVMGTPDQAYETLQNQETHNGIGGIVVGTGFNVCAFHHSGTGYNFEIGHYELPTPCQLDKEVSPDGLVDIESCVSGKILGNVLKAAIEELTSKDSNLGQAIRAMDKDTLNALIFALAFDSNSDEIPLELNVPKISLKEHRFLTRLCSKLTERVVKYLAAVLEGISATMINNITFFEEGSVLERNPWLNGAINRAIGKRSLATPSPVTITNLTSQRFTDNLPPSFFGAIFDAAAKAYLARK
jgi:hypothetical protein